MKLPPLLRLPKNRQFRYRPIYYDPVKDRIGTGESIFPGQGTDDNRRYDRRRITQAYKRRPGLDHKADFRQALFILSFSVLGFGYIYIGNYIFFIMLVLIPLYIWIRLRKS